MIWLYILLTIEFTVGEDRMLAITSNWLMTTAKKPSTTTIIHCIVSEIKLIISNLLNTEKYIIDNLHQFIPKIFRTILTVFIGSEYSYQIKLWQWYAQEWKDYISYSGPEHQRMGWYSFTFDWNHVAHCAYNVII